MNKKAIFLLIRGGHIIDPSQGLDQVGDLLIAEGKIAQIGGTSLRAKQGILMPRD